MTGPEIKGELLRIEGRIMELAKEGEFVRSPELRSLMSRQIQLREDCPHSYKEGTCIYCNKKEGV